MRNKNQERKEAKQQMPKYKYQCADCMHIFTIIHSISDDSIVCEKCGESSLNKQLSRFSLKSDNSVQTNKKVGSVVERSIEEFRDDLKEQKKEAKSVSYEPNQ